MQTNKNKNIKVSFAFTKTGALRYISHLDLMRLLMRAMRRSDLPLFFTEGFNPHPKLSLSRALKLGVESEHEQAHILLTRKISPRLFINRLNKQLPDGIRIKQAELLS